MRRIVTTMLVAAGLLLGGTSSAWACGSLVSPNGAVDLLRSTTLAAYHDGVEHYVTTFRFANPTQSFGSIVPLPAAPTKVERGGDWTLQRLEREIHPPIAVDGPLPLQAASAGVTVLQQVRIDALDVTVLRGGGPAVADWARQQGFALPKDTPTVLDFYARRSPYFLAAKYDGAAALARGLRDGDGIPVHVTIPIDRPWVPLRILAAGKDADEAVNADVFLLTDHRPDLIAGTGLQTLRSAPATPPLLRDLRADRGMSWIPPAMWLTAFQVNQTAGKLRYDLAIGGDTHPAQLRDTGVSQLAALGLPDPRSSDASSWLAVAAVAAVAAGAAALLALAGWYAARRARVTPPSPGVAR